MSHSTQGLTKPRKQIPRRVTKVTEVLNVCQDAGNLYIIITESHCNVCSIEFYINFCSRRWGSLLLGLINFLVISGNFKAPLRSRGAFSMSILPPSLCIPWHFLSPVIGQRGSVWLYFLALIGHNKGALRPPESRVSPPQVCLYTSVQSRE